MPREGNMKQPYDLVVGNWRGGVDAKEVALIETTLQRDEQGFRLLPPESTVRNLARMLDAYDALMPEFLNQVDSLTLIGEATAEGQVVTFDPPLAKGDRIAIEETPAV